jgi:prolipoprotein diacylglyceryltransferase
MGMLLSLPMIVAGIAFILVALRKPVAAATPTGGASVR